MTTAQNKRCLTVAGYHKTLEGVESQFALIRLAFGKLSHAQIRKYFKDRLDQQIATLDARTRDLAAEFPDKKEKVEAAIPSVLKYWRKQEKEKNKPADARFTIEFSEDRLNQSELLLLVAHFESFMKEVHQTFLIACGADRFSDGDFRVLLGESVDSVTHPFNKFLSDFISKEVKRLDAQGIDPRADYFKKYFGVSFASPTEVDHLKEIMRKRNQITHEIYTSGQHEDPPLALPDILTQARWLFWEIPRRCVEAGVKQYPSYFALQ